MKWTMPGQEQENLRELFKDELSIYIWGAGYTGRRFFDTFNSHCKILGFIDIDEKKQKEKISDKIVLSPDEVELKRGEIVVIANGYFAQIAKYLEGRNYRRREDYFEIEEFSTNFFWYKYGKLYLYTIGLITNNICSLKCKYCIGLTPYSLKRFNRTFEEMRREVDALFMYVDYLQVLQISGGDAILNNELTGIISYIGDKYLNNKIGTMELYTNGIVMPTEEMLSLLEKHRIAVRVSDYGKHANHLQKIEEIEKILKNKGIEFRLVKFDKWIDIGYASESPKVNGIKNDIEMIERADKCNPTMCSSIYNGRLFYCSPAAYAYASGLFDEYQDEGLDFMSFNEDRKALLKEYFLGFSELGYPKYCKKCNGMFNINNHFVEVAEQL